MGFLRIKPLLVVVVALATAVVLLVHSSTVAEQPVSAQPSHVASPKTPAKSGPSAMASVQAAGQAVVDAEALKAAGAGSGSGTGAAVKPGTTTGSSSGSALKSSAAPTTTTSTPPATTTTTVPASNRPVIGVSVPSSSWKLRPPKRRSWPT